MGEECGGRGGRRLTKGAVVSPIDHSALSILLAGQIDDHSDLHVSSQGPGFVSATPGKGRRRGGGVQGEGVGSWRGGGVEGSAGTGEGGGGERGKVGR